MIKKYNNLHHLTKDLHTPYSIIRDVQFAPSREKLAAARKWLKSQGKGNKPHAAEALEPEAVERRRSWRSISTTAAADHLVDDQHTDGHQGSRRAPQVSFW